VHWQHRGLQEVGIGKPNDRAGRFLPESENADAKPKLPTVTMRIRTLPISLILGNVKTLRNRQTAFQADLIGADCPGERRDNTRE
jgi:hypothetical protein